MFNVSGMYIRMYTEYIIFASMESELRYILIADDDGDDRDLLATAITDNNCVLPLYPVNHGLAVVDHLQQCNTLLPELILLDLNMPGLNGYEVLKFIKSTMMFSSIPVHILTTSRHPDDRQKCLDAGCDGFWTKPDSYTRLVHITKEILGNLS